MDKKQKIFQKPGSVTKGPVKGFTDVIVMIDEVGSFKCPICKTDRKVNKFVIASCAKGTDIEYNCSCKAKYNLKSETVVL